MPGLRASQCDPASPKIAVKPPLKRRRAWVRRRGLETKRTTKSRKEPQDKRYVHTLNVMYARRSHSSSPSSNTRDTRGFSFGCTERRCFGQEAYVKLGGRKRRRIIGRHTGNSGMRTSLAAFSI